MPHRRHEADTGEHRNSRDNTRRFQSRGRYSISSSNEVAIPFSRVTSWAAFIKPLRLAIVAIWGPSRTNWKHIYLVLFQRCGFYHRRSGFAGASTRFAENGGPWLFSGYLMIAIRSSPLTMNALVFGSDGLGSRAPFGSAEMANAAFALDT